MNGLMVGRMPTVTDSELERLTTLRISSSS